MKNRFGDLTPHRSIGTRLFTAALGLAAVLPLCDCGGGPSKSEDVAFQANADLRKLAGKVISEITEGAYGCGDNSQSIRGSYDKANHETVIDVVRHIPTSNSSRVDVYVAEISAPTTGPDPMRADDVTSVLINHEVDGITDEKPNRRAMHLMHLVDGEYRLVVASPGDTNAHFYGTHPAGVEHPLTTDELILSYAAADAMLDQMQLNLPECGGPLTKKV